MRLGVKGEKYKAKTLKLDTYFTPDTLPVVPFSEDIMPASPSLYDSDSLGNNEYGCCTIADAGHFMRRLGFHVTAKMVVDQYLKLGDGADEGLYAIDVMTEWRKNGLFGLPPIDAFMLIDLKNKVHRAVSVSLFGGYHWVGKIPTEVMDNVDKDFEIRDGQDHSAGGHMMWCHSYSPLWDVVNTWGIRKPASEEFLSTYGWEAYVVLHPAMVSINGRAECGLDLTELRAAIRAIT